MISSRRVFLTGLGASLVAAPAIVRAASLMPTKGVKVFLSPQELDRRIVAMWRSIPIFVIDPPFEHCDTLTGKQYIVRTQIPADAWRHFLHLSGDDHAPL